MQKKMLYGLVAVVVVAIVVVAAAAVILTAPPKKLAIELWYNNDGHYGDTEALLAQTLQQSIQACGKATVTLQSDTWAAYKQKWASGSMPMFLLGWYPDYFDSDDYVSPFLSIAGAKSLGSFYNNSQVDQWVTDEQTTTNAATRAARFASIQQQLAQDVPYIPLFSGRADVEYVNGVQNVVLHPVVFKWFIMNKPGATQLNASTTDKIISLDPASAYDYFSIEVINQVFDTLLVYDWQNTTLKPGLATAIPTVANGGVSADGKNYTYHLRQGVTFQDGSAFNASVVMRSIDRAVRLDIPGSAAFLLYDVGKLGRVQVNGNNTPVGTMTSTDPYNITFHLSQPVSFFNDLMAFSVAAPVPWTYSRTGEQPSTAGSVIGTGPYRLTQHTVNQLVELTAYSGYYNPGLYAPAIPTIPVMNKVVINIRSSSTTMVNDLKTKAVDVIYRTPTPQDLADLQSTATTLGITVKIGASPQIRYLVFNVNARAADAHLGTYTDARVRQAIAYSVDRAQIASTVFNNQVTPLYSMVPPQMPFSQPVFQSAYGDHNCASANSLLSQLGYAVGIGPSLYIARDE
ncbi:MAG: ABC transporter substrate-binding protein [Thermoplasmata archaeon]